MLNNAIFSLDEIIKIKNSQDENLKKLLNEYLKDAEEALEKEDRQSPELMALAYYVTGEDKYFEKVKKDMLALCEEECWTPGGLHGGSFKGRCELVSAAKGNYMAAVYSLFGDMLTNDEKAKLIENTYKKSLQLIYEDWVQHEKRVHALDTMGHNWWIVLVASGAYEIAILKNEIENSDKMMEDFKKCCEAWFKYQGNHVNAKPANSDKGAFWEGYSYLNYSLNEYIQFAIAYKNLFGKHPFDDEEILKEYSEYFMNFYYPAETKDYFVSTADTGNGEGPIDCLDEFIRYGLDFPEIRWYVNNRVQQANKITRLFITDELKKEACAPNRLNVCHDKVGFAVMRESYEKNSKALMIKCGDTWNHAHADAGHFSFYNNGVQEVREAGGSENYSVQSYQGYYVQSQAHNVVLFEGKGQDKRDNYKNHAKIPGKLVNFTEKDGFRYVLADCTGPMGRYFRKHHRHFLWLDKCIFIYDDIECYENGTVNFLLHAEENNSFKMLTPCEYTLCDGYKNVSNEINDKYYSYNLKTDDEGHAKFVSVICVDKDVEPLYEENEKYIKVTFGEEVYYVNKDSDGKIMHNNCIIKADGFETDAIILAINNGKYGVVNGSILRKDDEFIFGEWARINGFVN